MLQNWAYRLSMSVISFALSADAGSLPAAETPAKPAAPTRTAGEPEKPSAEAAIRRALTKNVSLWYHEVPLKHVAEDLETQLGVPVRLDTAALTDVSVDDAFPISFSISNVSARAAISLMFRKLQVTAITAHEVLLITSSEAAESVLATKVYDVSDFASDDVSDDDQHDLAALVEVITNCVDQKSWPDNGGPGTIRCFTSAGIRALVVSQNQAVLGQIDDLLAQLRSIRDPGRVGRRASSDLPGKRREAAPPPSPAKDSNVPLNYWFSCSGVDPG
jgi:hypothetical protein